MTEETPTTERNQQEVTHEEYSKKPIWHYIKKYPQYIVALIIMLVGLFYPMPDTSMIPADYMKIWALIVFCLGCFFPFVIAAISSRQQKHSGPFSFYAIIRLISLFSLTFGLGVWIRAGFKPDFFNIAFIVYGIGGYVGILLNRIFSK